MPNRNEFKALAQLRLKESRALFDAGLFDGCTYLAGYVVEMGLKACICRKLDLDAYPPGGDLGKVFRTHRYDDLLRLAGLTKAFDTAKASDLALLANWSEVTKWSENVRYDPVGTNLKVRAQDVLSALENPKSGVLTWLKKRW